MWNDWSPCALLVPALPSLALRAGSQLFQAATPAGLWVPRGQAPNQGWNPCPIMEVWSANHWTTREVTGVGFLVGAQGFFNITVFISR